jgi:hypothetical protein
MASQQTKVSIIARPERRSRLGNRKALSFFFLILDSRSISSPGAVSVASKRTFYNVYSNLGISLIGSMKGNVY